MAASIPAGAASLEGQRLRDRYEVREPLGRGGMAAVYRAHDLTTGRDVALKQLRLPEQADKRAAVAALFEREYHTLAQLSHPRVIAVYDYGVSPGSGPYYTMELLDGGDLRERAPLPWQQACTLLLDVCSSLSLLHSRRLLHRDISPRNVRCTQDGQAKLIDFGAMGPMGASGAQLAGTPGFIAPEVVHRSTLDARADLFSLGATLYYALTRTLAYPARNLAEVIGGWKTKPRPPSALVAGIPAALDDLVMSLLSLEPALRPHNAFEVMQRLSAITGLPCVEPEGVSRAYLATPVLVGREDTLRQLRALLTRTLTGRGGGVILQAASGLGSSRMLDACAIEAKTLGATVLRATATGAQDPFAIALGLTQQLLDALPGGDLAQPYPELFERPGGAADADPGARGATCLRAAAELTADADALQQAISRFMLTTSRASPLLIAVDDVHRIDEPSAAVLAELVDKAQRGSLLVALAGDGGSGTAGRSRAFDVLSRRCDPLALAPLSAEQTQALLGSVFGDVPNLPLLAGEIFRIARGNPRLSMDLAQHLVDRGAIRYASGTWKLPTRLAAEDLPSSAEDAIRARAAALPELARFLAEAQALAFHDVFTDGDYRALRPDVSGAQIELAIAELLAAQALVSDGHAYTLANRLWAGALAGQLDRAAQRPRHRALADMYRGRSQLAVIHHLFGAGEDEQGLDELIASHQSYAKHFDIRSVLEMNAAAMGPSYQRAVETAERLGRPARVAHGIRRWFVALGVVSDAGYYYQAAPLWRAQLERDSGLDLWRADANNPNPGERLGSALQRAHERYLATPEAERVYRVDEALPLLAEFVAISIAIGAKAMDSALLWDLPALLEPFTPLSPVLEAIWLNATATRQSSCLCRYEDACARWTEVLAKLDTVTGAEMQHVGLIRNAVAYALGMMQATFGQPSAESWAERIEQDPTQRLSALYLRKVVRLEQGDWAGAERMRREAEVLALRMRWSSMFDTLLSAEVMAHTQARDLVGLKDVIARIEPLAARFPGWRPFLRDAEARFDLIRGDFAAAEAGFEQVIALTAPDEWWRSVMLQVWVSAQGGLAEARLGLGRLEHARDGARAALAICEEIGIGVHAYELMRMLALAEARLGQHDAAAAQLDALIAKQVAIGASGLRLGLSHEARAQVAIWSGDEAAFEQHARAAAREYRYGARCPMSVRYERLLNEARRRGLRPTATLPDIEPITLVASARSAFEDMAAAVERALSSGQSRAERVRRGLQLVCDARAAIGGHFFAVQRGVVALEASHNLPAPPPQLHQLVREYLAREHERADTLTVVAEQSPVGETADPDTAALVAGTAYDLLLCACVVQNQGQVVGVIAAATGERPVRHASESQLLAAIAAALLDDRSESPARAAEG